ncbi:alpha-L-rhamnosidase-related protein [Algibacter mikhailovii]|uniref:alpha-L-rhamnosidase-related protein n=1 Tax=Algibacter mikhailovii TaxID=425498 RepID=UPI0024941EF1|nr:alpha-rhamnosidase [Algibacter mikhailovii]
MNKIKLTFLVVFCGLLIGAQNTADMNSKLLKDLWSAKWVSHPDITGNETGVYLFKKVLSFKTVPHDYVINISADNRYILYINGKVVARGPARGDLNRWLFDTIDIAPYLKAGENHVAAKVWNMAQLKPVAQMSLETGLIIQGNTEQEQEINTNNTWSVVADQAYSFYKIKDLRRFYASGPGEKFNGDLHPWHWKTSDNEIAWEKVKEGNNGTPMNYYNITGKTDMRLLCPRSIPMMEAKMQNFAEVRSVEGVKNAKALIAGSKPVKIPANSSAVILLDQGHLTNAYPQIKYSKGANSHIKITYAESLFIPKDGKPTFNKGNRNDVEGKVMWGNYDVIEIDGGDDRLFEPLWWRSFRYVELEITTGEEPLILEGFNSEFTGYPFELKSSFESEDSRMSDIFNVAWRTQRLCAGELFFDCPYYEQLQYTGDTRIQGLNTAYASGDTRLWKDAIQDYYDSRLPFGLTQSRYPSSTQQIIAPFSLVWITMVNDYMMHCEDDQFIEKMVPAILDILNWYDARVAENGMLGKLESWLFVDWVDEWKTGYPPLTQEKEYSTVIGMQYVYTIQKAMEIFEAYGMSGLRDKWGQKAEVTQNAILEHCWDEDKQLLADTPEKTTFSQHANVLAILSNAFDETQEKELMQRVFNDKDMAQTSFYFDFYKIAALKKAGLGDRYISTLNTLSDLIDKGLTTFPEKADPTRSDCHAWSASPLYYYMSLICGIEPDAPEFNSVKIEPHMGDLEWVKGSMPHRFGEIKVNLKQTKNNGIVGSIYLPENLTGTYVQNGKQISLKSGENQIDELH